MKKRKKIRTKEKVQVFHLVPYGEESVMLPMLPSGQYWIRQTGDVSQNKKLGPVSLDVGGFKFDNAPVRWALQVGELEVTSCIKLLRKFNSEARWWRKPLAWVRNPEREDVGFIVDSIYVLYGKNFHIVIEREDMFGPHACRLFYRSHQVPGEIAWIAIVQIECMWHSDERMLAALNHEIKNRRFWQSDNTAGTIVLK